MAGILDMLLGGDTAGADAGQPYLGILAPAQRQQVADNSRNAVAAALLAASGPSRMPTSFGSALGQAMLAGQQAEDQGIDRALKQAYMVPQIQGLNLANTEKALNVAGWQRYANLTGGSAPSATAATAGVMAPAAGVGPATGAPAGGVGPSPTGIMLPQGFSLNQPSLGILDSSATAPMSPAAAVSAPAPTLTAARQPDGSYAVPAAAPTPNATAIPRAPMPGTGVPAATAQPSVGAPPPPLFDVANLRKQYEVLASFPEGRAMAAQLLTEMQKGIPEGAYLAVDGSIQSRKDYDKYLMAKAAATKTGENQQMIDPVTGRITNMPGAVDAAAEREFGVKRAGAQAQQPYELEKIDRTAAQARQTETHKAGFEPMDIKVKQPDGSYQTLTIPRAYLPQLAATGQTPQGEPYYPPNVAENMKLDAEYLGKTLLPAKDASVEAQGHAQTLFNSLEQMRQSKLTQPGMFAGATIGAAKVMNDLIARVGGEPFKESELAGADAFQKSSTRLTAEMTRMLGSHEAAQIFMQIQGANPNWYMQPASNLLVTNLINQAAQRKIDVYNTGLQAVEKGGLSQSAVSQFDKEHPETEYVQRAFKLSGMDPAWVGKPQPTTADVGALSMSPGTYAKRFDEKYGPGRAAFTLNQVKPGAQPVSPQAQPGAPAQTGAPQAAPVFRMSATGANGVKIFSNDGASWFNPDGSPFQAAPPPQPAPSALDVMQQSRIPRGRANLPVLPTVPQQ